MTAFRHLRRSVVLSAALALFAWPLLAVVSAAGPVGEQESSVQRLLERGALEEAVQKAGEDPGRAESTFLAAQALMKMNNNGGASERYARLREAGDDSWKAIGESGSALIEGNMGAAMDAANRAVAANGDNAYAHYQLGLVANRQNNFQRGAEAFARSAQLKADLAYAHYYAAIAFNRLKQIPRMAEHLQALLRLAPDSPEKQTAQAMLRSLR